MNTDDIVHMIPTFKTFKMNSNEYKLLQNKINFITNEIIATDIELKKLKKHVLEKLKTDYITLIDNIEDITSWESYVTYQNVNYGIQIINKNDLHMENNCMGNCKMYRSEFPNSKNKYTVSLQCIKRNKILN